MSVGGGAWAGTPNFSLPSGAAWIMRHVVCAQSQTQLGQGSTRRTKHTAPSGPSQDHVGLRRSDSPGSAFILWNMWFE